MKPGELIQGHRTRRKTLFKFTATVIEGLREWAWSHTGNWRCGSLVAIAPHAQPVIRLRLLKPDPALLIFKCKEATAILAILEALLPTGKPIAILRDCGLQKISTTRHAKAHAQRTEP